MTDEVRTAEHIAIAFMALADRGNWTARAMQREGAETVYFHSDTRMVKLELDVPTMTMRATFTKVQCTWGDYICAIRSAMASILTVLARAGIVGLAPSHDTPCIIHVATDDSVRFGVSWMPLPSVEYAPETEPLLIPLGNSGMTLTVPMPYEAQDGL